VQPSLNGAEIGVSVQAVGSRVLIVVRDSGPGPAPGAIDGVGLGNTRARLAQAYGPAATLQLLPVTDGGCEARIEFPLQDPTPP
jgi:LytS/YehU family sensor histidine kinase